MIEGSSQNILNYQESKDIKKKKSRRINKINKEQFPPVLEKLEEYTIQSIDDQKFFSRESGIKEEKEEEENNNNRKKGQFKDSILSQIVLNLEGKETKNRTIIIKPKKLINSQDPLKIFTTIHKSKKSLNNILSSKSIFNKIVQLNRDSKRRSTFKAIKPKSKISISIFPNKANYNNVNNNINNINDIYKNERSILKKRKTMADFRQKKRSSQLLNQVVKNPEFKEIKQKVMLFKVKTIQEGYNNQNDNNQYIQTYGSVETNQKLVNYISSPKKMQSDLSVDNSRFSDDLRFSDLIKKNKIQLVRGLSYKTKLNNNDRRISYIENLMNNPNLKKTGELYKKIKKFALIQGVCSFLSIILCIIDTALYNNYSFYYIIENNIKYDKFYEIKNRKISSSENFVRILNGIFSFICFLMTICIFYSKYSFHKKERKKFLSRRNKNTNFQLSLIYDFSNNINNQIKLNPNFSLSKNAFRLLINILFYPPNVNYIYHSNFNDISFVYPFNSFILLLTSIKLYNIYRGIFYFLPVTGTLGKTICQRNNVNLNVKFMFRTFLSKHKMSFPFFVIIIISLIITILLQSIEIFSVDVSQYKTIELNNLTKNYLMNHDLTFYDTLWMYISLLVRNPNGDYYPKTPFGKILLIIVYIIGALFLCIIYFRLNKLILLDRNSYQAYNKLEKLFQPENKENKASDVIRAVLLLKKYHSLHNVDEMEEKYLKGNLNDENIGKRKTVVEYEIEKLREKNFLIFKQKKMLFLKVKFGFILKYFADIKSYTDIYKISRKQPLNISSMFQNIEDKMNNSLESINIKLSSIATIDCIFDRLKNNDNILLKKIERIKKLDRTVIKYLTKLVNYQCSNLSHKKKGIHTEVINQILQKRSKSKMNFNYKISSSCQNVRSSLK